MSLMKEWINDLPEKEKNHLIKLFERDSRVTFCADTWIKDNPDKKLVLRPCVKSFNRFNICPYDPNSEPCRIGG